MTPAVRDLLARAEACLREGRVDDGIAAWRAVVAADPALPDAWYNLGYLQRTARQFEPALESYARALAADADGAAAIHVNRAAILSEQLERTAEAEAELRLALAADPAFLPAWLNLGNLYEDLGDAAQARDAYGRALAVDPGCGRAYARLGAIAVHAGDAAGAQTALDTAAALPDLHSEDRAEILFALGAAQDALGEYPAAFASFDAANRAARAVERSGTRYDPAASAALVDTLIADFAAPAADPADPAVTPPVFICGMFRSGSTLLEQMLGRHHAVTAGGELEFLPALVAGCRPYPAAAARADAATVAAWRRSYATELAARFPGATRVTDKRPDNFLHIGLIKRLFPDARILHTRRQPLDNILSIWSQYFADDVTYSRGLDDAVHWYRQYRRLMRHWRALYGADILDVDYDRLVADPAAEIGGALTFLGLDWDNACLTPEAATGAVRTASVWQVRKPLHPRSSGRWRHYATELADARAALGEDAD